jgi:hypothetical protein
MLSSLLFGVGAAILRLLQQQDATVIDSTSIFLESVYKISRRCVDILIFMNLFGGWMWFRDGSDSKYASNFVQISEEV